jgi:membrane dipeptidase
VDHPRNVDDEQLRALAGRGGVIQAVALASFVSESSGVRADAVDDVINEFGLSSTRDPDLSFLSATQRADYLSRLVDIDQEWPEADVSTFVDHVDHAVGVVGVNHVGISSDFDGGGGVVGWNDASETVNVTVELLRRGYSEAEIAKLWGENLLRVLREVESVAAETSVIGFRSEP